jgi:hypothetical protein
MIKSTTDYTIFKKSPFNREIDKNNLKKIVNSIKFRNLLNLRPLLVDKEFNIIDGQHRLEAAKLLGLPIFYTIQEENESIDIILLNSNQKTWSTEDYLKYYIAKKNDNYIRLYNFVYKNNISASLALKLMNSHHSNKIAEFNRGGFIFHEDESNVNNRLLKIKHIQKYIDARTIEDKSYLYRSTFVHTLTVFLNREDVDYDMFLKKIASHVSAFYKCSTYNAYYSIFKSVYNYRNPNPID